MCPKAYGKIMPQFNLLSEISSLPRPADPDLVNSGFDKWHERARGDHATAAFATAFARDPVGHALLAAIFGNSSFLTHCLLRDLAFTQRLANATPAQLRDELLAELSARKDGFDGRDHLMTWLRAARIRFALLTAVADIAGFWSLDEVTGALTAFAETVLNLVADYLLKEAGAAGHLALADADHPSVASGFTILGMGKLGAYELNYSSDIDLIILYDQEVINYTGTSSPQDLFVRVTQSLVHVLQERTREGYVFRTDLRLRPDPGATPLAVSMAAAENYYESVGQNWERAAMIKARAVAGDLAAGRAFLKRIEPFTWRKNLDYAAIADIHSIKRQIHAHRGHDEIAVAGHDIKVGRGGIREIEFFAQTQQLIAGGRDASLRLSATKPTLQALARSGRLSAEVADELTAAYEFLRRLEHRLQMIADEQTHTVPTRPEGLDHIAAFMGCGETATFTDDLLGHLSRVGKHYAALFEHAPPLGPSGNLVFTGIEADPATLDTLRSIGYREPEMVSARIRSWHHGRYRATRSVRSRELLTALVPRLLDDFGRTANPDGALVKFDEFLSRLPSGVPLFSLFYENPGLLDLVAEIMGSAPRLADYLSHNPFLFDAVLAQGFFDPLPDKVTLSERLDSALATARDFEDVLDITRRWSNEHKFQIGVRVLREAAHSHAAGPSSSAVADVLISTLLPIVEREFARAHGRVAEAGLAVVGLGKLGAGELNAASDLDLIFVYDNPAGVERSDGPKPLPASQYFTRLSQRFINALSALTAEGRLYEVDMRLRPAGAAGPIASQLEAFAEYQRESAWTWEHMALTRARVVAAPAALEAAITGIIREVLTARRDPAALLRDVANMRGLIEREHGTTSPWDVKHVHGGLLDLEFLYQYLQLCHAAALPEVLCRATSEGFRRLGQLGILEPGVAERLHLATVLMHNAQGLLRLTMAEQFDETSAPEGLRVALARAGGGNDLAALRRELRTTQKWVRACYDEFITGSAAAAGAELGDRHRA